MINTNFKFTKHPLLLQIISTQNNLSTLLYRLNNLINTTFYIDIIIFAININLTYERKNSK